MSTTVGSNVAAHPGIESRIVKEGYGPGAWHGPDLKAALGDVNDELAFWRPARGRHNIAEIALHHAWCIRSARSQLSGRTAEPFVLNGEDWFDLADGATLAWPKVQAVVDAEQQRLETLVADIEAGRLASPLADADRFNLVLGITCHAIYHAGQVQLVKRLRGE